MPASRLRKSFTLIEILVVLGIITIVAALLLPVFFRTRGSARSITCVSNLRQVGLALHMYQSDWDRMPISQFVDSEMPGWKGHDPLQPYSRSGAIYHCPEAQSGLAGNYEYRAALSLSEPVSGQPPADDAKTIDLSPTSVLTFCFEHAKITPQHTFEGSFNVVRAGGSCQKIPAGRVAYWVYSYSSRQWVAPPASQSTMGRIFAVFPDEPWPPEFNR